jgi:hypothetical protein
MSLSIVSNPDGTITIGCAGGGGGGTGQVAGAGGQQPVVVKPKPKDNPVGGWGKPPGGDVALVHLGELKEIPTNLGVLGGGLIDPAHIRKIASDALEAGRLRGMPVLSVELTLQPGQHVDVDALREQMGELGDQVQLIIHVPAPLNDPDPV